MAARIAAHPTVREQFAAQLVAEGVITAGGGRRARARVETMLQGGARAAEGDVRAAARPTAEPPPRLGGATNGSDTAVPAERLRELETRARSPCPTTSPSIRSSPASSSAGRSRSTRAGSTGARPSRSRSPRLLARGHPGPPDRPGHRARHVLAPPPRPPRREHGRAVRADPASRRRDRVVRGAQLAALRVRLRRLRVRLLGRRARGARPLGGPVRRLRQRRADHPRPVRHRRPLEVGRDARA